MRRQRILALEFGLNPFTATDEDIARCGLELHKVALPEALAQRAHDYLRYQPLTFADLLRTVLDEYLTKQSAEWKP